MSNERELARDAVIAAAKRVETARTAPPETFDMREFWYGINDLTMALCKLEATETYPPK